MAFKVVTDPSPNALGMLTDISMSQIQVRGGDALIELLKTLLRYSTVTTKFRGAEIL